MHEAYCWAQQWSNPLENSPSCLIRAAEQVRQLTSNLWKDYVLFMAKYLRPLTCRLI